MKSQRTKWAIAIAVVVGGIWLFGVFYVLSCKPDVSVNSGILVSTPSPVAAPVQPVHSGTLLRAPSPLSHRVPYTMPVIGHSQTSTAVSSSFGLYLTSSAEVHSVGGGGGQGIVTMSHSSSSRGVSYSSGVVMPTTNFVAMASSRQVAEPEAQTAPQMAKLASSPRKAPGPPNPTGPLPEGNQLVEHPIGDAILPLLVLLAGYALATALRRRRKA